MTRWSAITRTPPQPLRTRLRLALHSYRGKQPQPARTPRAGTLLSAKLDHAQALRRVEALMQRGDYDAEIGARLAEALEAHRLQQAQR